MKDQITVVGNIAGEPRLIESAGGTPIADFRIASTERRFDQAQGRWVDEHTNWYRVSAFRALARNAAASLHTGDRVIVQGRLRLRAWTNGDKRGTSVEIEADAIGHDLLSGTTRFAPADDLGRGRSRAPGQGTVKDPDRAASGSSSPAPDHEIPF